MCKEETWYLSASYMVALEDLHTSLGPRRRKIRSRGVTVLQATFTPSPRCFFLP